MYCSLREAYSVPAFDTAATKARRRASCGPPSGANGQQAEAYYGGRELAAAHRPYGREDFVSGGRDTSSSQPASRRAYSGVAHDYDHYCSEYQVCPGGLSTTRQQEGFEDMQQKPAQPKTESCGPLQPPPYEYPVSAEAKRQLKTAMETALGQSSASTPAHTPATRVVDMSRVQAYSDDEDLDMYLRSKDLEAAPIAAPAPSMRPATEVRPHDAAKTPLAAAMGTFKGQQMGVPLSMRGAWSDCVSVWMDILLAVCLGLLFIGLCDQITKLATMLGMKQAASLLLPLLETLREQSIKNA